MDKCIYTPCLRCVPACIPIDTPEAHAEHARIVEMFQDSESAPYIETEENSK